MDVGREVGRGSVRYTEKTAPLQRGHTQAHGGCATQAMGGEEDQRASRLSKPQTVGLCLDCTHARVIRSDRGSTFYLCRLSATDPNFTKYPRLPVLSCSGYKSESPDL